MANIITKTVHNIHVNDYAPPPIEAQPYLHSAHPKMYLHRMVGFTKFLNVGLPLASQVVSRFLLLVACLPLLAIKHLPEPLHQFPVRGFYYSQWRSDLKHIVSPFKKITYASARIVDACRLFAEYGIHKQYLMRTDLNECECKCK